MPPLIRFLTRHAAIGFAIAVICVCMMLWIDVGGLRTLASGSDSGPLAVLLLTAALGLTFGSVQMGFAIMLLGDRQDRGSGKRNPVRRGLSATVHVTKYD